MLTVTVAGDGNGDGDGDGDVLFPFISGPFSSLLGLDRKSKTR